MKERERGEGERKGEGEGGERGKEREKEREREKRRTRVITYSDRRVPHHLIVVHPHQRLILSRGGGASPAAVAGQLDRQ